MYIYIYTHTYIYIYIYLYLYLFIDAHIRLHVQLADGSVLQPRPNVLEMQTPHPKQSHLLRCTCSGVYLYLYIYIYIYMYIHIYIFLSLCAAGVRNDAGAGRDCGAQHLQLSHEGVRSGQGPQARHLGLVPKPLNPER